MTASSSATTSNSVDAADVARGWLRVVALAERLRRLDAGESLVRIER